MRPNSFVCKQKKEEFIANMTRLLQQGSYATHQVKILVFAKIHNLMPAS